VSQATRTLGAVLEFLDSSIQDTEMRNLFLEMRARLPHAKHLIQPHRTLHFEGKVTIENNAKARASDSGSNSRGSSLMQQRVLHLWLFNDVLVHVKSSMTHSRNTKVASTKYTWPLNLIWIEDRADTPSNGTTECLVQPRESHSRDSLLIL